jgi:hypothetical protein
MEFRVEDFVVGFLDFACFEIVLKILDGFVDTFSFPGERGGFIFGERFFSSVAQGGNQEDRGESACQKSGYSGAILG